MVDGNGIETTDRSADLQPSAFCRRCFVILAGFASSLRISRETSKAQAMQGTSFKIIKA
ncbi:hypothetical protein [Mesorhizobium helmanticense]|uniref:hypothetical protein n=1 Tax=Mesorhizobium helmanticense TaxID=1776423 RepID=UPI00142E84A1|nr:hypothetical protein [Mesorhizobium helmanticense]